MLLILVATCRQTLTVLESTGNAVDGEMADELRRIIAHSESELDALTEQLDAHRNT